MSMRDIGTVLMPLNTQELKAKFSPEGDTTRCVPNSRKGCVALWAWRSQSSNPAANAAGSSCSALRATGVRATGVLGNRQFLLASVMIVSVLISASTSQAAQEVTPSPTQASVEGSIWYDAEKGSIKPIVLEPSVDDSMNRNSRWLPKPEKVRKRARSTPIGSGGTGGGGGGIFGSGLTIGNLLGWCLLGLLLVLGVGAIMLALSKADVELTGSAKRSGTAAALTFDEQTVERMKHLPAELRRTGVNPRSEAERLMKAGLYDQAIILLFGHQLLLLDRHAHLRLNRGKTNRRYLRECRSSSQPCSQHLAKTVQAFERSYFGRHEITAEEFTGLWSNNDQLENVADPKPEVAA